MTLDQRIRADIAARIHSGEWRPGHRIPFEHELVAAYGCSRATVSKALQALARAGLIERRRKAGSFVAHPHLQAAALDVPDLARAVAAKGEDYRWVCTKRRQTDTGELAPAILVEGVHYSGADPLALETRLIALAAVPEAADQGFETIAPGTWLLDHVPWTRARHTIRAIGATRAQAEALGIAAGSACLQIERWTWRLDAPVTHVRQLFPGDRYDLVAEFEPSR